MYGEDRWKIRPWYFESLALALALRPKSLLTSLQTAFWLVPAHYLTNNGGSTLNQGLQLHCAPPLWHGAPNIVNMNNITLLFQSNRLRIWEICTVTGDDAWQIFLCFKLPYKLMGRPDRGGQPRWRQGLWSIAATVLAAKTASALMWCDMVVYGCLSLRMDTRLTFAHMWHGCPLPRWLELFPVLCLLLHLSNMLLLLVTCLM